MPPGPPVIHNCYLYMAPRGAIFISMQKQVLARKLNTRFERIGNFTKGYPWYQMPSWAKRKAAIAERVQRKVDASIKRRELRNKDN